MKSLTIAAALLLCCSGAHAEGGAVAELRDGKGNMVGQAIFTPSQNGVDVRVTVRNLPAGPHGIHLHEKGVCEAPNFESAGGHFNPHARKHGAKHPEGRHAGDLPNLVVKSDGTGQLNAVMEGATIEGGKDSLLKEGGTALVIHAAPDDEISQPTGASGGRIACGIIKKQ